MARAVFLDTNILIDLVDVHRRHHADAAALVLACAEEGVELCACASSLKDVYYVACRHYLSEPEARATVIELAGLFEFDDLRIEDVLAAAHSDEPDIEDGIICAVAERSVAEAIITRDKQAFAGSKLVRLSPEAWLETCGSDSSG